MTTFVPVAVILLLTTDPVELPDAPTEIISMIRFSPTNHHLLVGSWDGTVRLYDTHPTSLERSKRPMVSVDTHTAVTAICWDQRGRKVFAGAARGQVLELDLENSRTLDASWPGHELGVQSICNVSNDLMVSGSWDKSLHYVDHRSNKLAHTTLLPQKVFAMDTTNDFIVVGMGQRAVHVYDVRNLSTPFQIRESGLRYQTRDLKCMPNGLGYAQSSIEGRVAIEYFNPSPESQAKKYAFKCHRLVASDADLVSPVNALAFHKTFDTLFTAGSDCHVCLWDHVAKKRLRQYSRFEQSVVGLDTASKDGVNMLAIATSDDTFKTFATMDEPPQPSASHLYIRQLGETEGAPKIKN